MGKNKAEKYAWYAKKMEAGKQRNKSRGGGSSSMSEPN